MTQPASVEANDHLSSQVIDVKINDVQRLHQNAEGQLLVLPKDNSGEMVAVGRKGEIESTFSPERYEYLMERFAVAYEQLQMVEYQQESDRESEWG